MAINIQHLYTEHVNVHYYDENGFVCQSEDYGNMDAIAERVCKVLVRHNFCYAHVLSIETNEVLINIERS